MDKRAVLLGELLGEHCSDALRSGRLKVIGLTEQGGIPSVQLSSDRLLMSASMHHGEFEVLVYPQEFEGLKPLSLALVVGALSGSVPHPGDESGQLDGLAEHLEEIESWARSVETWTELQAAAEEARLSYPRRRSATKDRGGA